MISELNHGLRSPLDLHAPDRPVEGGFLKDFIAKSTSQMAMAADAITEEQFIRICNLLTDPRRRIYILGGRISDTIAKHLTFHLRLIRKDVYHLPADDEIWPDYLLRMRQGDILYLVDFRRYEARLDRLANQALQIRQARVLLMTDKWISPIAKHAHEVMHVPIDSGTLWDTYSAALAVTEAIVTHIAEHDWDNTRARMETWETLRLTPRDDPT